MACVAWFQWISAISKIVRAAEKWTRVSPCIRHLVVQLDDRAQAVAIAPPPAPAATAGVAAAGVSRKVAGAVTAIEPAAAAASAAVAAAAVAAAADRLNPLPPRVFTTSMTSVVENTAAAVPSSPVAALATAVP